MFRKMFVSVFVLVLITLLSACGEIKSAQPAALNTPVGDLLTVTSTNAFTDQFNGYHVVGTILNKGGSTLTALELSVEIKDASGNSLLKDDSGTSVPRQVFAPMLDTLAQGEASPFDFSYDLAGGTPASYTVSVAGYESGQADRAALKVENVQIVDDAKGTLYLSGKLINTGSQWARVNSLAGYVVGNADTPLAAGSSFAYVNLLAPAGEAEERDRTPFVIAIPNPAAGQDWGSAWRISWDADQAEAPADNPVAVNFTNSYLDQEGAYHIVGYVTNNSRVALSPELVAGLFDENGTVLDAASTFYSGAVVPGKTMPFNMSYFGSVNSTQAEAARVRTFTVQVDPARTTTPTSGTVELEAIGEQVQKDGAAWTFSGTVTNTTDQNLAGAMVTVSVNDGQNNLVATNSNYILPRIAAIAPDETIPYKITVSLDPMVDSASFLTITTVVGDLTK
jgi:hypothetical protein